MFVCGIDDELDRGVYVRQRGLYLLLSIIVESLDFGNLWSSQYFSLAGSSLSNVPLLEDSRTWRPACSVTGSLQSFVL